MSNQPRLSRVFRTCAVELLSVQFAYYDSLPTHHPEWELQIAQGTVDSLLGLFPMFVPPDPYRPELVRPVNDYLLERQRQTAEPEPVPSLKAEREQLRESYFASFPYEKIKVIDVCWAAQQHVREWRRWLAGERWCPARS